MLANPSKLTADLDMQIITRFVILRIAAISVQVGTWLALRIPSGASQPAPVASPRNRASERVLRRHIAANRAGSHAMDANQDEAARCLEVAERKISDGLYDAAERLVAKSERMFPLPAQAEARARILALRKTQPPRAPPPARKKVPEPAEQAAPEATDEMVEIVATTNAAARRGPHAVLGVPADASEQAIKSAYRKLILRLHPDKNFAPGAEDAFKSVQRAFETLTDPHARDAFDKEGDTAGANSGYADFRPPNFHPEQFHRPHMRRRRRGGISDDDLHSFFEMFDHTVFEPPVNRRARYRYRAGHRGGDVQQGDPTSLLLPLFLVLGFMFFSSLFSAVLNSLLILLESLFPG